GPVRRPRRSRGTGTGHDTLGPVPGPPGGKQVNSFVRALRTPELRAKIFFTLGLIAVYRLGVYIPTPGFDATNVMRCSDQAASACTAKLTQYTRYLTIGLGVLQSTTIITLVRSGNFFVGCQLELVPDQSIPTLLTMLLTMTVGTVLIMFMGEMITERGVGNGMSLMII